jgi:DNA helicase HerA-like ATPase
MDAHLKLGNRDAYYMSGPVRLTLDDRRRHLLISGRSGTGKSTLLANLFAQDANAGRGVLLLDPHGDLATTALSLIPSNKINKTIYINPADIDFPIGFNVLDGVHPDERASRMA